MFANRRRELTIRDIVLGILFVVTDCLIVGFLIQAFLAAG